MGSGPTFSAEKQVLHMSWRYCVYSRACQVSAEHRYRHESRNSPQTIRSPEVTPNAICRHLSPLRCGQDFYRATYLSLPGRRPFDSVDSKTAFGQIDTIYRLMRHATSALVVQATGPVPKMTTGVTPSSEPDPASSQPPASRVLCVGNRKLLAGRC
jgi:hypothetical protein